MPYHQRLVPHAPPPRPPILGVPISPAGNGVRLTSTRGHRVSLHRFPSPSITHYSPFFALTQPNLHLTQRSAPFAGYAHLTRFARPGVSHTADADPPQHTLDAQGHADELPAAMQFNAVDEEFDFVPPPGIMEPPVIQPKPPTWDSVETPVRLLASFAPPNSCCCFHDLDPLNRTHTFVPHTHDAGSAAAWSRKVASSGCPPPRH